MTRPEGSSCTRHSPCGAIIIDRYELRKHGSDKSTYHLDIDITGTSLDYEPGDAVGIIPRNDPDLVALLLKRFACDPEAPVQITKNDGTEHTVDFTEALEIFNISTVTRKRALAAAQRAGNEEFTALFEDKVAAKEWLWGRDLLDLYQALPELTDTPQDIINQCKPLVPRLYSIASSLDAHPNRVHVTLGIVSIEAHGRTRNGVASNYLAHWCPIGRHIPCFIHHAKNFSLPTEANTNIIMVGPGTGIAPFRSFLQQRHHENAQGKAWLFFGDQRQAHDFLYEEELNQYLDEGSLHNLDLAFSRDQDHKVYVQNRMREQGAQLWAWLKEGAHFYVCGDARRMAKDVDQALHEIISEHGGMSIDEASVWIKAMKTDGRYQRDVYAIG